MCVFTDENVCAKWRVKRERERERNRVDEVDKKECALM